MDVCVVTVGVWCRCVVSDLGGFDCSKRGQSELTSLPGDQGGYSQVGVVGTNPEKLAQIKGGKPLNQRHPCLYSIAKTKPYGLADLPLPLS